MNRTVKYVAAMALLAGSAKAAPLLSSNATTTFHKKGINGVGVFYREAGPAEAATILLLHGFPSSSREFDTLIPLLATHYHVIALDYPGFGLSGTEKLKAGDAAGALALMASDIEWITMWHYKVNGRGPEHVAEGLFKPLMAEWTTNRKNSSRMVTPLSRFSISWVCMARRANMQTLAMRTSGRSGTVSSPAFASTSIHWPSPRHVGHEPSTSANLHRRHSPTRSL